jgi:hypothetical protein
LKDFLFAYLFDELSLEDRCYRYWCRFLLALSDSTDGEMIFDRASLNLFSQSWVEGHYVIKRMRVSKRYVDNKSVFERCMEWVSSISTLSSVPNYDMEGIKLLRIFPESSLF